MFLDLTSIYLPSPVALAVVAVIGYLVGRRRKQNVVDAEAASRREMKRAQAVAKDLEQIAREVRKSLARHHASVARFKGRVSELGDDHSEAAWQELCREAEEILGPTIQLATQLAQAYDKIRQQSNQLMTFTEVRTDQLTGVSNRRAMDDTLKAWVAMKNRYELVFSIVIFDIDHFKKINDERGHLAGDQVLQSVARLMDDAARETDVVTRYGGEEFVILMPQTGPDGACIFSERMRKMIEMKLQVTVSGGIATAEPNETPERLLERADAALYHAKSAGRNRISFHNGVEVEAIASAIDETLAVGAATV
jgi:diguanylate cyclase (GGDEF)-like protein